LLKHERFSAYQMSITPEFTGNVLMLLREAMNFVKSNTKERLGETAWWAKEQTRVCRACDSGSNGKPFHSS
ncbi:hypothetical protein, partial [Prevotella koreensis]|uniref:hypothetical protein n=1 Tax=Prevotella koreensis TaxID=2490854 RepID=UPI0028E97972